MNCQSGVYAKEVFIRRLFSIVCCKCKLYDRCMFEYVCCMVDMNFSCSSCCSFLLNFLLSLPSPLSSNIILLYHMSLIYFVLDVKCLERGGKCQHKSNDCDGEYWPGYCHKRSDICCIPGSKRKGNTWRRPLLLLLLLLLQTFVYRRISGTRRVHRLH